MNIKPGISLPCTNTFFRFHLFILVFSVCFMNADAQNKIDSPAREIKALDYFITQGYQNSPLLNEYMNLSKGSGLDSARIRAIQKPQISVNSIAQYFPSIGGVGYNQAITNGGNYQATVNLTQPIFNNFQLNTLLQGNKIRKDSIENSGKISLQEIKRNIINQYILAYADQKQVQFQKEILDLFTRQEVFFKKLVQKGIYKQSDYLTFLVSRQAQEITITQSEISLHNNLALLNQLSGIADTSTYLLKDPEISLNELKPLASTYQYQKYEIDSLSLSQQRQSIKAYYRPKVNWFADAGYISTNFDQFYKSFGTSIGLSLNLPLYDGHQRKIASKQVDLLENTRKGYFSYFKKEYTRQILSLKKQLFDTEILENQLAGQLKNNQLLVDVDRKLLEIGDLKINDLILAINNYKNIRFTLSQIEINRITFINQLNFWSTNY